MHLRFHLKLTLQVKSEFIVRIQASGEVTGFSVVEQDGHNAVILASQNLKQKNQHGG